MDDDKKKLLPLGAVIRVSKAFSKEKDKGASLDVYRALAKYSEKQIELLTLAACDKAEADGRKVITYKNLKDAGDLLGVEFPAEETKATKKEEKQEVPATPA